MKKNLDLIYAALIGVLLVVSGVLLFHNSPWATPLFVFSLFLAVAGIWVEARGWELLFEFISGHLPSKEDK